MPQIQTSCQHCGKTYRLSSDLIGKRGKCKACDKAFTIEPFQPPAATTTPPRPVNRSTPPRPAEPVTLETSTRVLRDAEPLPTPTPQTVVHVHTSQQSRGSSLGVASLVLGIVAFCLCWIPVIGLLGIPLGLIGVLLGVIGLIVALFRRGSGIGYPIAGLAVCILSIGVTMAMTVATAAALEKVGTEMKRELDKPIR